MKKKFLFKKSFFYNPKPNLIKPNQTKPNQTNPNLT